ncbi:MAG: glycoside hydrolase family 32 protein [Epsilonproteobacteria bacterium]|nr:glycoside hydrolase family 32 protein [Campylobacterota bacterium]
MRVTFSFLSLLILLLIQGCGGGGGSDTNTTESSSSVIFDALRTIPVNQAVQINVPTYDGTNQVVHPDIQIRNNTFYLTITPYPWSNADHENPSFFVSGDGFNWQTIPGCPNPLVQHPIPGYNDDPDLVVDNTTNQFRIYYNETYHTQQDGKGIWYKQYLNLLSSDDGVNWTKQHLILYELSGGDDFIVSPAVVHAFNQYFMFYVKIDTGNYHYCKGGIDPNKHIIKVNFSSDGIHWDKSQAVPIGIDIPADFNPWHINVFQANGKFYMLIDGYHGNFCNQHNLYIAVSTGDLAQWHFIPTPIVSASRDNFDSQIIYRSTAVADGDDLFVYYSFHRFDNRWQMAVKHMRFSDLGL